MTTNHLNSEIEPIPETPSILNIPVRQSMLTITTVTNQLLLCAPDSLRYTATVVRLQNAC
jgi:hypothetical protein